MKEKSLAFREKLGMLLHSIRFRLVLWFTAILAVILASFSAFLYITQAGNLQQEAIRELDRRVVGLVENMQTSLQSGDGSISLPRGMLRESDVFILLNPAGKTIAHQGSIPAEQVLQAVTGGLKVFLRDGRTPAIIWTSPSSENYVFVIVPVQDRQWTDTLILGSILDPNAVVRRFLLALAGGSLLTLLIALAGGFWLADRAMRPVKTITRAAQTISETDLNRRLNLKTRDELGEMANTFDLMLGRLQSAFERQRQFIADASHELRTPLTIVNLEASRVTASPHSKQEYQQALNTILGENKYMNSLVNDLLTLARMDAGQLKMEKQELDLSELVVDTLERLAPLATRKGVSLVPGSLPQALVKGDRKYLGLMLSNLVENAIKYASQLDSRVEVETAVDDREVRLQVSDNGPGIPAEHLPHLFERFYRVDKARTRNEEDAEAAYETGGSGLGLSIVQWIARQHGAEVTVASTPGTGTRFVVRFPKNPGS
jgi:two-component system OmpR family sensor kinase